MLGALLGAGTDRAYYKMGNDRVLLMNRDTNPLCTIEYQGYYDTDENAPSYWVHTIDKSDNFLYNLQGSYKSVLWVKNDKTGARDQAWHLLNCRHGNTYPTFEVGDEEPLPFGNYFPRSSSAWWFLDDYTEAIIPATAGQIVMQNTPAAQIVSSCYSNGIGTIYFDAVNGFTGYRNSRLAVEAAYAVWKTNELGVVADEAFRAKLKNGTAFNDLNWTNYLEWAENDDGEPTPVPPDGRHGGLDEIHIEITYDSHTLITTTNITYNSFGRCAWVPLKLSGAWWSDNKSTEKSGTIDGEPEELKLQMPMDGQVGQNKDTGGGKFTNFYRVWAPVQSHEGLKAFCRGPMRFRIRRLDTPRTDGWLTADDLDGTGLKASQRHYNALILVDNVIASYPAMGASLLSDGEYDTSHRLVRNQVGWAGSFSSRYPAKGEKGLIARAKVIPNGAGGEGLSEDDLKPAKWVTDANMYHRWRYLDQDVPPTFEPLPLEPNAEGTELVSTKPLDMRDQIGDVEFYYEMELNAPYYGFVDFSGSNNGSADPDRHPVKLGYCERLLSAESRFDTKQLGKDGYPRVLPSCGTDYYTRLREGKSDQLAYMLLTKGPDGTVTETEFWVTEDKRWCTCFALPTNAVAGAYKFRIAGLNPEGCWTGESTDPAVQPKVTEIPWSGKRLTPVKEEEIGSQTKGWTTLDVTADSGYLMFQIFEDTPEAGQMTYTIVRAEYQNFNQWNDAAKGMFDGRGLFVGSSEEDGKRSGVSPAMRTVECTFDDWPVTPVSGRYWGGEDFSAVKLDSPGYESYKKITSPKTTPGDGWGSGGWTVGNAMWVPAKFASVADGAALQLLGQGEGYMQYVSATAYPRGIGEVSFRARLGQYISFNDFCYRYQNSVTEESPYLKEYTYYQPVIMGEKNDFEGLATVSLVACYQPGTGCYEFRVERIDPDTKTKNKSLRLSLYKWAKSGTGVKEIHLGSATNSATFDTTRLIKYVKNSVTYTANMFITVKEDGNNTRIEAGLNSTEVQFDKNRNPSSSSSTADSYSVVSFLDKGTKGGKALKSGSYGFLSKDCPAVFTYGCHFLKPAEITTAGTAKTSGDFTYYSTDSTVTFYCGDAFYRDDFRATDEKSKESHTTDWTLVDGRYRVNESTFGIANVPGVEAIASEQKVSVTVVPKGSTAWDGPDARVIATNIVSSFGMTFTNSCPYSLEDASIRIGSAGTEDDLRTDVVIDDVKVTQWRGDDFDNTTDNPQFKDGADEGCPNAVVFTAGRVFDWLVATNRPSAGVETITTNRAVELAAMRVDTNAAPATIRSPLFDGKEGRGTGLGALTFEYADADTNHLRLVIQVCTNDLTLTRWRTRTKAIEGWDEFLTIDFTNLPPSGIQSVYLGLHEIPGAMRILVHPDVVKDARDPKKNPKNDPKYGSVAITRVVFRDEPKVDIGCWWGWNIRTTSESMRQYLFDHSDDALSFGMSAGLNNSVHQPEAELRTDVDEKEYKKHMPFVQTPTFTNGRKIGEVAFNARLYDTNTTSSAKPDPAAIAIYGAVRGDVTEDSEWEPLTNIVVELRTFERFHYKAPVGKDYAAFRFAVTGVDGVEYPGPKPPTPLGEPVRVLLDEVVVSEAVYPRVGFSNVRPFRHDLDKMNYIEDIMSVAQQPMFGEAWGVQAEIAPTMLPDEIDMTKGFRVYLHWLDGDSPWGFSNWEKSKHAKVELYEIPERKMTFRGSYLRSADSIYQPDPTKQKTGAVVQYMLEVVYTMKSGEVKSDWMLKSEWVKPEWYDPIDYNDVEYAASGSFAGYTILDEVPFGGYAGINEINLFGGYTTDGTWANRDKTCQYVETRLPMGANVNGWHIDFVTCDNSDRLVTNTVATFGLELPASKARNASSNYVFVVAASELSKDMKDPVAAKEGRTESAVDGIWKFPASSYTLLDKGQIAPEYPIAVRLVRKSGVIEHEVVAQGTNYWQGLAGDLAWQYSAERMRERLAALAADDPSVGSNKVIMAGHDATPSTVPSIGVIAGYGKADAEWVQVMDKTPGRINAGQSLNPDFPTPSGTTIVIYSNIEGPPHLRQTFGAYVDTSDTVLAVIPKGGTTNITYHVDTWYEIDKATATMDGKKLPIADISGRRGTVKLTVGGTQCSNNVTVITSARMRQDLIDEQGLGPDNRYTRAILEWLNGGRLRDGTMFAKDDGVIRLADYVDLSGIAVTNLDLTAMYWLDIDPTEGGWVFKAGMKKAPSERPLTARKLMAAVPNLMPDPAVIDPEKEITDRVMGVYMKIYNRGDSPQDKRARPPTCLRGLEPGSDSNGYAPDNASPRWTNVTFKITGYISNGLDDRKPKDSIWLPLRWFVFHEGSFNPKGHETDGVKDEFEAIVEVLDPFSPASPAYNAGWSAFPDCPVFYRWAIDDRLKPVTVEVLKPDSRYPVAE